jgi:hypothetical protein
MPKQASQPKKASQSEGTIESKEIVQSKAEKPKQTNNPAILIAIIGALATIIAATLGASFGNAELIRIFLSPPTSTPTPLTSFEQILTADAIDAQRVSDKATIVAQATQTAQAVATQQYLDAYDKALNALEVTRVFEQAQQDVATKQVLSAQLTAQSDISSQGTATASSIQTIQGKMENFWLQSPNIQPIFIDSFDNDSSGWFPKAVSSYSVSIDGQINISVDNSYTALPFVWTCDKCGPFSNYLMQVDITTPSGVGNVLAGVLFGSPSQLDKTFQYSYALLLDSSGAVYLRKLSAAGDKIILLLDKRNDIIAPDGKPRTVQIIGFGKYLSVYINGNNIISLQELEGTTDGYIGVVVSTAGNTKIQYDNLKIVTLP